MMLNTAIFSKEIHPTGVRDLVLSPNVLQHQWQSLLHSIREIFHKAKEKLVVQTVVMEIYE
jgi:hypothetical protein